MFSARIEYFLLHFRQLPGLVFNLQGVLLHKITTPLGGRWNFELWPAEILGDIFVGWIL